MCFSIIKEKVAEQREKRAKWRANWTPEQREKHNKSCREYAKQNRDKINDIQNRYRQRKKAGLIPAE